MKIITLLPSAAEIVCDLGLQKSLISVRHECDYPIDVKLLPKITSSMISENLSPIQIDTQVAKAVRNNDVIYKINGDLLSKLKPDVIITQGICDVCAVDIGTVREAMFLLPEIVESKVQIISLSGKNFSGILDDISKISVVTKTQKKAECLKQKLINDWQQLRQKKLKIKPSVLMLEWPEPFYYGGHWVPEMVEVAGGFDVFGQAGMNSACCDFAEIQEKDPDIIILIACGYSLEKNEKLAKDLLKDPLFKSLRAVTENRVWAMDSNSYCSRPSPRIVEGAKKLKAIFENNTDGVAGIKRIV